MTPSSRVRILFRISYIVFRSSRKRIKTIYDMRITIYGYSFFFSIHQKRMIPKTQITAITIQWFTPKICGRVIFP